MYCIGDTESSVLTLVSGGTPTFLCAGGTTLSVAPYQTSEWTYNLKAQVRLEHGVSSFPGLHHWAQQGNPQFGIPSIVHNQK